MRTTMSEREGKTYRYWNLEHYHQAAYSLTVKLSEEDLVFFLLDTVPRPDLS
jgi:hypothetical protein